MALLSILILYKKRTNSWLSRTGLQLPVGENQRGSVRRITYSDGKVKIQNPIHMTQMQEKLYKAGVIDDYGNMRKSVDDSIEDRNLVAVHNLSEEKLQKGLKLGGFPMPSIAVTKHDSQHEGFGDISLFFTKDTINPDTNSANKVYSGDAWTPMYPKVEYKLNQKKAKAIQAKAQSIGYDTPFFNPVDLYEVNLTHYVDNFGTDLVGKFKNDYGLKNVFLKDTTGKAVEIPEKAIEKSKYSDEVKFIADKMPLEMVLNLTELDGKAWLERYEKQFVEIYNKYLNSTGSKPRRLMKHVVLTKAKNALDYLNEGDAQIKETIRD